MFDILCVTNRQLCKTDFLTRVEEIAKCFGAGTGGMILREKDLNEADYKQLAIKVLKICRTYHVKCILHNFPNTAKELNETAIHLPLPVLRTLSVEDRSVFTTLGASCHSAEEAKEAQELGCTYITAGHVFATDCKKGAAPRGIPYLKRVCAEVTIPVYAIGGISEANIREVYDAGAAGACVMSTMMQCRKPKEYLLALKKAGEKDAF